jgi:glycolate oxidase iron-sulfur subunit
MMAADAAARVAALADQCVKCGLCLPHCPTYRVGRNEAESPRGRIALAQALARTQLESTPASTAHLDQCLACLHCERVCPSHVRYGELIVQTRALLHAAAPRPRERLLSYLLARPRWLGRALRMANWPVVRSLLRSRILGALLRPIGLGRLLGELPRLPRVAIEAKRQIGPAQRGRVGLFLGCVASAVDRDVHASAVRLLTALGYAAELPRTQGCCGALALHAGDLEGAASLAARLRGAFVGVDVVLVSASGCFGTLRDHVFKDAGVTVRDIHEFLDGDAQIDSLRFRSLSKLVAVHTPCTQTNVAHAAPAIRRLLQRIPQLQIAALPDQPGCCGAAGDYFLKHAQIADALRAEELAQARQLRPDMLATSNVGCRIFLDNGLRQAALPIAVTHPLVLLAEQLQN